MFGRTSLLRAAALCAFALAASLPSTAAANDLVPSLGIQTGVTLTRSPGNDTNDYFVAATPQLMYFIEHERALIAINYAFTGSLNTVLPNAVANSLSILTSYDLAPKTRLLFGANALQSLIGNYLVVRGAGATRFGQVPPLNTSLLTIGVNQAISHEITPVVRLTQGVTGSYVTSLDPDIQLRNYLATATVGIDRAWEFDAVGGELNIQYGRTFFPPLPTTNIVTVSLGPTWDHDFSPRFSGSAGVSAQVALSPDPNAKTRIGPAGRASMLYSNEGSGIGLEYAFGIEPNILLGTLLQSHQATVRGFTPLSERYNVLLGLSGGYLHGKSVDLGGTGAFDNSFDAILHDADVTWAATDFLSLFVRYQFIGQTRGDGMGVGSTPAIVRHGAIVGCELFAARPPPRSRLPQAGFPKRVDGADGPQQGKPGSSGAPGIRR